MKKINKGLVLRLIFSILIVSIGILSFIFEDSLERLMISSEISTVEDSDFKMYVVDVGQGDAVYMEFKNEINVLVDCGPKSNADDLIDFLDSKSVSEIDYVIYTHSDEDHIGGGASIFEKYQVKTLYRPKELSKTENETYGNADNLNIKTTQSYDNSIMCAYAEEDCEMKYSFVGEKIFNDWYSIEFLAPFENSYSESNDYSAVVLVEVYGKKILLQGDAESNIEEDLIDEYGNELDIDILKVSHHGSKTASATDFLEILTPEYAFISVGENQWDFPSEEVLTRLEYVECENIFDTKTYGTIVTGINSSGKISIYSYENYKKMDMPILLSSLFVILLLIWGIKFKSNKKNKRKSNKTI